MKCLLFIFLLFPERGIHLELNFKLPPSLHVLYINRLAKLEEVLYQKLVGSHIPNSSIVHLEEYLTDYRSSRGEVFEHPLLTYRMLYRFAKYLPSIMEQVEQEYQTESNDVEFPGDDGLFMGSLLEGRFGAIQAPHGLTPLHGLQLVKHGLEVGYYVQIWSWLSLLKHLLPNNAELQELKDKTILAHDETYQPLAQMASTPLHHAQIAEMYRGGMGSGLQLERNFVSYTLCSNSSLAPEPKANFHCWNDRSSHHYFLLFDSPPIYQFHDIVGNQWIRRTVEASTPGLETDAMVVNRPPRSLPGQMSFTFLKESELPDGRSVAMKLERVLGLHLRGQAGDDYRISVYHTGGDGDLHIDAFRPPNQRHQPHFFANRLGTLIVYMGDTKLGGETVFPDLGLKVRPVRGSGLFWTHYKRHGHPPYPCKIMGDPMATGGVVISAFSKTPPKHGMRHIIFLSSPRGSRRHSWNLKKTTPPAGVVIDSRLILLNHAMRHIIFLSSPRGLR
ncbi:Prolyl 4-hydroxylase subunit alpha-2 [Folsomia candida]|uniref:Prolyl 4-hydroxylase subunit alpha-2 n=1 Tax=Folsomia candida TaxID=158441 RepID=A0A226D448_FOLCA|nr:Prolyl 4-hydroxylase subunit alpha-2 [Folsomia candida]